MKHVAICICTFRRQDRLAMLLDKLMQLRTDNRFTYSVIVIDNDSEESARTTAESFVNTRIRVVYYVEQRRNIARARNRAINVANGDYLAFIDDDEMPSMDWLMALVKVIEEYNADGVLGPVHPHFMTAPPDWITRGNIFMRPSPPSGTLLKWNETRTGNVLFRRSIFANEANRFDPQYGVGGEDVDLFRRLIAEGLRFVWCGEATVLELVPPERCRRSYVLRRALSRGKAPYNRGWVVVKSVIALPVYTVALPMSLMFGQHIFMRLLIKICDHLGRILAMVGINVVGNRYVSE